MIASEDSFKEVASLASAGCRNQRSTNCKSAASTKNPAPMKEPAWASPDNPVASAASPIAKANKMIGNQAIPDLAFFASTFASICPAKRLRTFCFCAERKLHAIVPTQTNSPLSRPIIKLIGERFICKNGREMAPTHQVESPKIMNHA